MSTARKGEVISTRTQRLVASAVLAVVLTGIPLLAYAAHHNHSAWAAGGTCTWDGRNFHSAPDAKIWANTRDITGGGPGCGLLEVKIHAGGGTVSNSTMLNFVQVSKAWNATHTTDHNADTGAGFFGFPIN